jgi:hypothetical protein
MCCRGPPGTPTAPRAAGASTLPSTETASAGGGTKAHGSRRPPRLARARSALDARSLLDLTWESFESHPERVEPHQRPKDRIQPYAAGATGGSRIVYFPVAGLVPDSLDFTLWSCATSGPGRGRGQVVNLRTGTREQAFCISPTTDGTAILGGGTGGPLPRRTGFCDPSSRTDDRVCQGNRRPRREPGSALIV